MPRPFRVLTSASENGAWGQRFFESDHDYAIVDELTQDCRFGHDTSEKPQWLKKPKLPFKMREYMNGGGLVTIFTIYHDMLTNYTLLDLKDPPMDGALLDSPRYYLMCLGLLAIEHGWRLDKEFVAWLKANYASMYLNKEREVQAKMVLHEFQIGTPCRLGDVHLSDMMRTIRMMSKENPCARNIIYPDGTLPSVNVLNTIAIRSKARMLHDNKAAKLVGGTKDTAVDIICFTQNGFTHQCPNAMQPTAGNTTQTTKPMHNGLISVGTWREDLKKQNKPRLWACYTMDSPYRIEWPINGCGYQTASLASFYGNDAPGWTDGAEDDSFATTKGATAWLKQQWHAIADWFTQWWHTLLYPLRLTLDNFAENPYRLPGWIYLLLALCFGVNLIVMAIANMLDPLPVPKDLQGWSDSLRRLPLVAIPPLTLFLFPPLLINVPNP